MFSKVCVAKNDHEVDDDDDDDDDNDDEDAADDDGDYNGNDYYNDDDNDDDDEDNDGENGLAQLSKVTLRLYSFILSALMCPIPSLLTYMAPVRGSRVKCSLPIPEMS